MSDRQRENINSDASWHNVFSDFDHHVFLTNVCVFFPFKMWVYVLQLWDYFTIQTCFSQFWEHKKVWVVRRKLEFWRKTNLNFVIYKLIIQIKGFWLQIKGFWLFPLNSVFTSHNNIFLFPQKNWKNKSQIFSRNSDFVFCNCQLKSFFVLCEFVSYNSAIISHNFSFSEFGEESLNCKIKSHNYQFNFFIQWKKWAYISYLIAYSSIKCS